MANNHEDMIFTKFLEHDSKRLPVRMKIVFMLTPSCQRVGEMSGKYQDWKEKLKKGGWGGGWGVHCETILHTKIIFT